MGGYSGVKLTMTETGEKVRMGDLAAWQKKQKAATDEKLKPTAEMQAPSLSDEAIRNAILSERNRALAGNSRKQAFAVRGQSTSYLGE